MSSLVRRIQLRLLSQVEDMDAYREMRAKLKAGPKWNRPLIKKGRPAKALRRSKRSQKWLEARAQARKAATA